MNLWFYEELLRRLDKKCIDHAVSLGDGAAADSNGYYHEVGFIRGLKEATEMVKDIKREMDS